MKKLIIGLSLLIVSFLAIILVVPSLIPSDVYKTRIQDQLSSELGRDVTISGQVKLQTFPFIRAKTEGVTIQNPQGFSDTPFLSVKNLEARIRLLPLLSKRVEISGFELLEPKIWLEKNAQGQANWVTATSDDTPPPQEKGPFKRNGGFNGIDPQIAAFTLTDGQITYQDAQSSTSYTLSDIDGALALPSLSKPFAFDLAFDYEGESVKIEANIDSLRAFLDGKIAPIQAEIETSFAKISIDGRFLASEAPDFTASIKSELSDFKAIQRLTPKALPYIELLNSLKANGEFTFENGVLSASGANIDVKGDGMSATYQGAASLSESPVLDGSINVSMSNFLGLKPYLPDTIPPLDFIQSFAGKAVLNGTANGFQAQNITTTVKGEDFSFDYNGSASMNNGKMEASGLYTTNARNIEALLKLAEIETPYSALLGTLQSEGQLAYKNAAITLSEMTAKAEDGAINGRYDGSISLDKSSKADNSAKANGAFSLFIPDLSVVAPLLPNPTPYSQAIKTINAKGKITTQGDTYALSNITATLQDGLLNGEYKGQGRYNSKDENALSLSGRIATNITDMRALAALGGTSLLADTDAGSIFDTLSISGDMSGTLEAISLTQAQLEFDKIKGTGEVDITLSGAKPYIDASLDLEGLDLRPYMASYSAQNPTGEILPWNETPINVAPFKGVDGAFAFTSPNVITDRIHLGQTNIDAVLKNGRIDAKLPKLTLYGGTGNVNATFDTNRTVPKLEMTIDFNGLESNSFLNAVAGFDKASGGAKSDITLTSSGHSQAEIMRGLNGQGLFALANGAIKGIDVAEFMTGLDQAIATRSLPSGLGATKTTTFENIQALFKIENGVVKINDFDFKALGVAASGGGTIDLGGQSMDFSFRPRLTTEKASNLAAFGIPLRFSGDFGSAKASLDTAFLSKIAAEKARAEAASRIQNEIKGPVGSVIGGLLGGSSSTQESSNTGEPAPTPTTEDAITNALGGLFGNKKSSQPQTPNETSAPDNQGANKSDTEKAAEEKAKQDAEKKKREQDLKKALGSIFGE